MDTLALDGPPVTPAAAPCADAPVEDRRAWCLKQVDARLEHMGAPSGLPNDVRPGHLWEVEFNSCVLDPVRYEADISSENQTTPGRTDPALNES